MAAALDFPLSPSLNDIYVANGNRWQWNGTSWKRLGQLGPQGTQGTQGIQGVQGTQGIQGVQGSTFNRESFHFIATNGQTDFSVLNATANNVDVFVNGVHLTASEFTIVNTSTIRLHEASVAGDIVDIFTFESAGPQGTQGVQGVQGVNGPQGVQGPQGIQGFSFLRTEYNYTATAGQTTFAATYVDGTNIDVFLNGVRLTPADYTATSGTNVVLSVGASAGDVIDILTFESAGPQGTQGISGIQGIFGVQGAQGTQGIQGIQGVQGINLWVSNSAGIHTFSNVGIGTTNPSTNLDVKGTTTLESLVVSGIATFQEDIYLGNDDRINLGTGGALQVYHDGTNSYVVDSGAGDLYLRGTGAIRLQNAGGTENYAIFNDSGTTELYYDNSKKLETLGAGVTVYGTTNSQQLLVSGITTLGSSNGIGTVTVGVGATALLVDGNARVTGVLTVGQSSITLDGSTNTINVGSGVTIHTTTSTFNQLEVVGLSTFVGVATFQSNVFAQQLNVTSLVVDGGATLGEDITTRNLSASGIVTVTGATDLNGDLDVDGHTELDNVNVSGVSTFVGVSTFKDKVVFDSTNSIQIPVGNTSERDIAPVAGQIRYNSQLSSFEGYGPGNAWGSLGGVKDVNQDTYIIPESSAGANEDILYFYNAGSNTATISSTTATINVDFSVAGVSTFVGVSTFQNDLFVGGTLYAPSLSITGGATLGDDLSTRNISASGIVTVTGNADFNGNLDVDGQTEVDDLNVSGIATINSLQVSSNFDVYDTTATFHNNLYIAGNLSIGGTTTVIQAQDLQVFDKDIILGVTTDANNNDVSNDTTANHGGIAVASTEGSPLVDLYLVGLETSPVTYKKLMWFKAGSFAGLGTDAWLSNYAVGIGSTQVPNGVRLAAGGVHLTDNTVKINSTEVLSSTTLGSGVTASSLRSVAPQLISDRVELTTGQPDSGDYILIYDNTDGALKKATISNAALQGVQGIQGVQGTQGTQGIQGTQGTQGTQGVQGTQGTQGTQGVQGTQGIQGIQGIQGTFGTQGVQGIQGTFGTQGTQGIQGLIGNIFWDETPGVGISTTSSVGINTTTVVGTATSEGALQIVGNVAIVEGALLTDQNVDTNIFIPSGRNGLLIGPVTVGVGITVDIAPGSVLVVV